MGNDERWGFEVSDKRKQVWECELYMLEYVKTLCDRYELTYYAIGGTLLGAVRHNGFIPWDDDLDIAMPRKDYEQLLRIIRENPSENISLQSPWDKQPYFQGHAKLRLKNTTAIRKIQWPERYEIDQGIFIDIFPLDNIPNIKLLVSAHRFLVSRMIQCVNYGLYFYKTQSHSSKEHKKNRFWAKVLSNQHILSAYFHLYESVCRFFNLFKTENWGLISVFYYKYPVFTWKKEWFNGTVDLKFENHSIKSPLKWDDVLTYTYGKYMEPVRGGSQHGDVFFDVSKSYLEYISEYDTIGQDEDTYIL